MTGKRLRRIECKTCQHVGFIDRKVPVERKVRCSACRATWQIREICGDRPVKLKRSAAADMKRAAAQDILRRYGGDLPEDSAADLFR